MMVWRYSAVTVVSAAALVLTAGCASRSGTATRSSAPSTSGAVAASPTGDLSGTWQGYAGTGGRSSNVTLSLRQEGAGLRGNLAVGGRPDLSGAVTGTVDGDTLRVQLASGAVGPQLQVKGDTMTGMISGEPLTIRRVH